jgi:hypothetical protein
MLRSMWRVSALALVALWASGAAAQGPPGCMARFAGSWMVTVVATGQTYPSQIFPNGTLSSTCPFCMPVQNWTCNGNTFMLLTPVAHTHTLSADGRTMSGGCCSLVRVGPAPSVARAPQGRQAAPQQTTGASRWLPPGSPNAAPAAQPPPRNPFGGDVHMGNRPVTDPGPRVVQPGEGAPGLSDRRRREIDRLRNDRRALERYIGRLPARERESAWQYAGRTRRDTQVLRLGGETVAPPSVQITPPGQTYQTNLEECRRAAQAGRPPPPACNVQAVGGGPCTLGAGCTSMTCSVHLQYLQIRVVPRLDRAGIISQMNAAGCGGTNFCYVPRPGTAQVCGRG